MGNLTLKGASREELPEVIGPGGCDCGQQAVIDLQLALTAPGWGLIAQGTG